MINRRRVTFGLWAAGLLCTLLAFFSPLTAWAQTTAATFPELTVYRSPTCQCCSSWVDHMEAAGFEVQDIITEDMAAIKDRFGVPAAMASCHTAIAHRGKSLTTADGYLVEGHVPAADVQRLLREQSEVLGIAAPGMPVGSPGMEMGDRIDPYTVFSFTQTGDTAPFTEHR